MDNLSAFPDFINRGTTVKVTRGWNDFPANGGWTAKVYMVGASSVLNAGSGVSGTPNGANFDFALTPVNTDLVPGDYRWEVRVTNGTDEYVAEYGKLAVLASLESAAAGSVLSKAEAELAAIEAEIAIRHSDDVQESSIQGRSMVNIPIEQLYKRRETLREEVWREKNPGRIGPSILTVFTSPQ